MWFASVFFTAGFIINRTLRTGQQFTCHRLSNNHESCMMNVEFTVAVKAKKMMYNYSLQFPDCPSISFVEVATMKASNNDLAVVLVDVRTKEERKVSMIEGALDVETFEQLLHENPSRYARHNCVVIPYCTIGYRSGKYGSDLCKKYNLSTRNAEGIVLYTHSAASSEVSNIKLIVPNTLGDQIQYTNRVHTFGKEWDLLASGGLIIDTETDTETTTTATPATNISPLLQCPSAIGLYRDKLFSEATKNSCQRSQAMPFNDGMMAMLDAGGVSFPIIPHLRHVRQQTLFFKVSLISLIHEPNHQNN